MCAPYPQVRGTTSNVPQIYSSRISGVSVSLFERNGRWYAIVYIDKRQKWIPLGSTKTLSKKQALAAHDELSLRNQRHELVIPPPITFQEFSEIWLRDYAEIMLKPVTISEYRGYLRKYLIPKFGSMKMTQIRPSMVQQHIASLVRQGNLKPKTIRNQMVPMKRMFELAIQWGYATSNPAAKVALPRQEHEEIAFLSPEQVRLLVEATDPQWKALIALGAMCGLRKGECLGLQHSAILWTEHRIKICRSLWNGELQDPKTKRSIATLPMPSKVEALLMERVVMCPASDMNLVFCRDDGSPLRPDYVNRGILAPALEKAGLPRITFHGLRHSFVAGLIQQNVNVKVVQELARHTSIQTTLDKYGHVLPESKEDAIVLLEQAIWGSASG